MTLEPLRWALIVPRVIAKAVTLAVMAGGLIGTFMKATVGSRFLLLIPIWMTAAACGGGGTTGPSPTASGLLDGTWKGTITFSRPTPMTVPTTWTFRTVPLTLGTTFDTQATWMGITTRALTSTSIGAQFSTNGVYPSPLGCDGSVGGLGTADGRMIDATFSGSSSCDSAFEGHLTLTR